MNPFFRVVLAVTLVAFCAGQADANKRSRGHSRNHVNNMHHSKPSHNVNVNHRNNVNINQNNVNVNANASNRGYGGCCYHGGYHPVATAAAVTATVIVVGSIVRSLPPSCNTVVVSGFAYQQCGNTWYQPQISGSSTTYIVVNPPY